MQWKDEKALQVQHPVNCGDIQVLGGETRSEPIPKRNTP
jgi:hypothetical protein